MFKLFVALFLIRNVVSVSNSSELLAVVVLFRHGARTIIKPYPNDPYKNESLWPVGFGQLTNEGKMQHYELGQYFRNRYGDLLPRKYSEKVIYVRSTDVDRTLMSAEANLAGLYPPVGNQVWDKNVSWQPIPIHTQPEEEDPLLAFKKPCARYKMLYEELMNSEEIKKINEANKDLFDYLNLHSGEEIKDFDEMEYLFNTLTIESYNNFTLPNWTKSVYPDKMKSLADFSFALPCYTKEMARFKTGPFFNDLLDYFKSVTKKEKNENYLKMKMFSGHDTTVANILESLRIFQYHSPPFASTIMIELYKNKTQGHYVNILYKNSTIPQEMILDKCEFNCPFEDFIEILSPLSISMEKWRRECEISLLSTITESKENLIIASGLIIFTVCLIAITVKLACDKTKKDRTVYLRLPDDEEQV